MDGMIEIKTSTFYSQIHFFAFRCDQLKTHDSFFMHSHREVKFFFNRGGKMKRMESSWKVGIPSLNLLWILLTAVKKLNQQTTPLQRFLKPVFIRQEPNTPNLAHIPHFLKLKAKAWRQLGVARWKSLISKHLLSSSSLNLFSSEMNQINKFQPTYPTSWKLAQLFCFKLIFIGNEVMQVS